MINRKNDPRIVFQNKSQVNSFGDKNSARARGNEFRGKVGQDT